MRIGPVLKQISRSTAAIPLNDAHQEAITLNGTAFTPDSPTPASINGYTTTSLNPQSSKTLSPEEIHTSVPQPFEEYIPRAHLTVAPVATTLVSLELPPGEASDVRYVGVLLLYIDETGKVQDAIAQEPLLPEAYELSARSAFLAANFSPGEFAGQPVKSSLRVEVVFEDLATR